MPSGARSAAGPANPRDRSLGTLTWCDAAARAADALLVVPVGSTEQHGPHLPLATDTLIAEALAQRLADARPDVLVAPPVSYGSSGEHGAFPGTLSIGQQAIELVVTELVRSADAFAGVLLLSAHGGNQEPVERAVTTLRREGRRVRWWAPSARGARADAHAGHVETSLLLAVHPERVRTERAEPGNSAPLEQLWAQLRAGGVAAVSANGVLGDPTGASAEAGRRLLDELAQDLVTAVEGWPAGEHR